MQIIDRIDNWQAIRDYCNQIKHHAQSEQAKCARGRQNFWLQAEPDYSMGLYRKAIADDKLWTICKDLQPKATVAQIYFADKLKGIDWHKDARYFFNSGTPARILNMGNAILECKNHNGRITTLNLTGGEPIQFDSQAMHKGTPLDSDRIGMGIWHTCIDLNDPRNWTDD
jgi:hypothetical protein